MDYLPAITLVVASVAVILSLWQFFTRHRPFVGISKGVLNYDDTAGYSVDLTLRNWGDVQANTIRIILESEDFSRQPYSPNRRVNVLFPNQETLVVWGAAISEKARSSFEIESVIQVDLKIEYSSPGGIGFRGHGYGKHRLSQSLWISPTEWGIMSVEQEGVL